MKEISAITGKLLALSMLPGLDSATLRKLVAHPEFETASLELLAKKNSVLTRALDVPLAWSSALVLAEEQAEQAWRFHARILSSLDTEYPTLLTASKHDPCLLYVRGQLAVNASKSVVIGGTRHPTAHGSLVAARVARYFVEQGCSVISGLGVGCESIAHRAVIDAKGHTVAVLAQGLQISGPSDQDALADDIIRSGGALVSQFPFGRRVTPRQFIQRARTQAGMAQGVVMVQADVKEGGLSAGSAGLDYGRWLAVPYPTKTDRLVHEKKVSANLLLADATTLQKLEYLHLHDERVLSRLIILRSKGDYAACIVDSSPPVAPPVEPAQLSIF